MRSGTLKARPRTQSQVALSADGKSWSLLNASPDLRAQLLAYADFQPAQLRDSPIANIFLTNADLDHILGLFLLREGSPLRVYATSAVQRLVERENRIFAMLRQSAQQLEWCTLEPNADLVLPDQGLSVRVLESVGKYPLWAGAELSDSLPLREAQLGLDLSSGRSHLVYIPGCGEISPALHARLRALDQPSTTLLFDGTFWTDSELQRVRPGARSALAMGHLPQSGPNGSLAQLRDYSRMRKIFVHINNTNPLLDEESPEHREAVEAGWEIGYDGQEINL